MIVWLPRTCHKRTCRVVIFDCYYIKIINPEWLWSKNSVLFLLPLLTWGSETIHRHNAGFSKSKGYIPDHFLDSIYDVSLNKQPRLKN